MSWRDEPLTRGDLYDVVRSAELACNRRIHELTVDRAGKKPRGHLALYVRVLRSIELVLNDIKTDLSRKEAQHDRR